MNNSDKKPAASLANLYMLAVLINMPVMSFLISFLIVPQLVSLPYSQALLMIIAQSLSFLPPFLIYMAVTRRRLKDVIPMAGLNSTNCGLIILMCLAIQPAMGLLSAVSSIFFENNISTYMLDMYTMPLPLLLLAMAVTPAVFEEITLRGIILKNHEGFPIKQAALVNGLFFGIMHLDPQQFLYAFMMGIIFCYFVHYTRSILASILAHFCINASQSLLGFISYSAMEALPDELLEAAAEPGFSDYLNAGIFLSVMTAIFLPVFIIMFRAFVSYNKHRLILDSLAEEGSPCENFSDNPETIEKTPPANMFGKTFWLVVAFYLAYVALSFVAELIS